MNSRIRNPFKLGDTVRRRCGTLGADGSIGRVIRISTVSTDNDNECLTVDFGGSQETFIWSTYEAAS